MSDLSDRLLRADLLEAPEMIREAADRLEVLEGLARQLAAALKAEEWREGTFGRFCSACGGHEHSAHCPLAAALAAAQAAGIEGTP